MAEQNPRSIFLNLPVRDLKATKAFFAELGFHYNPQFTNDDAACMVINPMAYAMLITEPHFKNFTRRELIDSARQTEAIFAFSCGSREEVDVLADKAFANGATPAMDPQDHGFMYLRSFYDLDGHHWEVFWMDPGHVQ